MMTSSTPPAPTPVLSPFSHPPRHLGLGVVLDKLPGQPTGSQFLIAFPSISSARPPASTRRSALVGASVALMGITAGIVCQGPLSLHSCQNHPPQTEYIFLYLCPSVAPWYPWVKPPACGTEPTLTHPFLLLHPVSLCPWCTPPLAMGNGCSSVDPPAHSCSSAYTRSALC